MAVPAYPVKLIQSEVERLTQYLHTLPPSALMQPSACEGWEVRDVIGHLTWAAEFYVDSISRGVQGDASVSEDRPPGDAPDTGSFNAYIASRAVARRESLGEQLLPRFGVCYDELSDLLTRLKPQDWERPCAFWRFTGNIPARAFLFLTMQEVAIHGWDIRSRLESAAPLSAESLPVLMTRLPARFGIPGYADFRLDSSLPTIVRYRFALTGAISSPHDILVENGKARMESASPTAPDVTFCCDTSLFVLTMYRRLTLDPAVAAGHVVVEGDQELIMAFDRWLKGV